MRLAPPAKRHSVVYAGDKCLIRHKGRSEFGLEITGRDGIASDPIFAQFGSKGTGEAGESAFGGCVGVNRGSSQNTEGGRCKDNSSMPLATHWGCCRLS